MILLRLLLQPQPSAAQIPKNILKHQRSSQQHVIIPVSQNPIANRLQRHSPPLIIVLSLPMLTPIQLDDQLYLAAHEICDVACDGNLPSELESTQLLQPKVLPEAAFGVSG